MARFDVSHRDSQRIHALRRLYQRHGLAMTVKEYAQLCEQIIAGDHPPSGIGRNGGTLHTISHRGKTIVAVFSAGTAQIATFLPAGTPHELRQQP